MARNGYLNENENISNSIPEKKLFYTTLALALLTTLLSGSMLYIETNAYKNSQTQITKARNEKIKYLSPPVEPINLLPESILQYETKGRQKVPGAKYPSAESIYEILDGNIALASPVNSYVIVTYFPSSKDASDDIKNTLKFRYPVKNSTTLLGTTMAEVGFDQRQASLFIGWSKQQYSIKIFTSFLDIPPTDKQDTLEKHAMPIAKAIEKGVKISE